MADREEKAHDLLDNPIVFVIVLAFVLWAVRDGFVALAKYGWDGLAQFFGVDN